MMLRGSEVRIAEPLTSESSDAEFEIVIEKLERHKSKDIFQFLAE